MKLGLLTTYSFNYGSYHQAIALQKQLQDMGHECELINESFKKYKWFNLFLMYTMHPILPKFLKEKISDNMPQYKSFLRIQNDLKDVKISAVSARNMKKLSKSYDCIVLGSDELWSANSSSIRYVPEYFGYKIECPHISYATAAVQFDGSNSELCNKVRDGLLSFEQIAVRDIVSQKIINKITNRKIGIVLDPTLLNPFFATDEECVENYILLYGQHYSEEQKDYIQNMAKNNKLEIVCVGWPHEWSDRFMDVETAAELQKMFAKATFCFPSTFHGTIFSIVNKKQFFAMLNPLRGKKIEMLLNELNLESRIFDENAKVNNDMIDYCVVQKKLDVLRQKSLIYLKNALEDISLKIGDN